MMRIASRLGPQLWFNEATTEAAVKRSASTTSARTTPATSASAPSMTGLLMPPTRSA